MTEEGPVSGPMITRRYRYEVRLPRPTAPGEVEGEIVFGSAQDEAEPYRLPVRASARAAVSATPRRFLASLLPGEEVPRFAVVLTTVDPGFRLRAEPRLAGASGLRIDRVMEAAGRCAFEISPDPRPESSIERTLVFDTNHPSLPTIEVPYSLRVVTEPASGD